MPPINRVITSVRLKNLPRKDLLVLSISIFGMPKTKQSKNSAASFVACLLFLNLGPSQWSDENIALLSASNDWYMFMKGLVYQVAAIKDIVSRGHQQNDEPERPPDVQAGR